MGLNGISTSVSVAMEQRNHFHWSPGTLCRTWDLKKSVSCTPLFRTQANKINCTYVYPLSTHPITRLTIPVDLPIPQLPLPTLELLLRLPGPRILRPRLRSHESLHIDQSLRNKFPDEESADCEVSEGRGGGGWHCGEDYAC